MFYFTYQMLPNGLLVTTCLLCSTWIAASPKATILRIAEQRHKCSDARSR
jgi:hypothetical protein